MRPRRRYDAARPTHEQRIVERLTQSPQRLADRRLTHSESSRGTAHTELVVERDSNGQQVEVRMLVCQRPRDAVRSSQREADFECLAKNAKMSGMLPEMTLP